MTVIDDGTGIPPDQVETREGRGPSRDLHPRFPRRGPPEHRRRVAGHLRDEDGGQRCRCPILGRVRRRPTPHPVRHRRRHCNQGREPVWLPACQAKVPENPPHRGGTRPAHRRPIRPATGSHFPTVPDAAAALQNLIDELAAENLPQEANHTMAATVACHSVVRAADQLTEQEMQAINDQLENMPEPHHCPHGRPTAITMSNHRLEREFRRC